MSLNTAFVGMGSNLNDPVNQLSSALNTLQQTDGIELIACSSWYQTKPVGPQDQPDYVNAVCLLKTGLQALELLDKLQAIELEHGRQRGAERWGPRTLDLDILLFNGKVIHEPRLIVPHPEMHRRCFVLKPLHEIAPDLVIPNRGTVEQLLNTLDCTGVDKIEHV